MNAYQRAVKDITDQRRDDLDGGLAIFRAALAADALLNSAYVNYQKQAVKNAQKLPNTLEEAREELKKQMTRASLDRSVIEPPYRCKLCSDTGYVDGKYCRCVINRVIKEEKENLVLPITDFDEKFKSAPGAIKSVYEKSLDYIHAFPNGSKPFFVLSGSSGTGKTVWASAVASAVMRRGGAVVTVTAFDFVQRAKDYHTQFSVTDYVDLFTPMLECDLLVIDDLGTETMLKNITREYFYTVVNERWLRKKYTLITTNLTPKQLLDRYGEAVFSRLCDKNSSITALISAKNKRLSDEK